jgi:hypothetical protein
MLLLCASQSTITWAVFMLQYTQVASAEALVIAAAMSATAATATTSCSSSSTAAAAATPASTSAFVTPVKPLRPLRQLSRTLSRQVNRSQGALSRLRARSQSHSDVPHARDLSAVAQATAVLTSARASAQVTHHFLSRNLFWHFPKKLS